MGLGHWLANIGKVAGYVAAPFTGGLSLLAEPAIGAAEGAANGGGWKGALEGGAIGGLEAAGAYGLGKIAGPVLNQALGKVGGGVATNLLNQEANKGAGSLMSHLLGGGGGSQQGYDINGNVTNDPNKIYQNMDGTLVDPSGGGKTLAQMGGAGGILSNLLNNKQGWADASKAMGGIAEGEAQNRYKKGEMTQGYDKLMLQAQQDRNVNEADALKKLAVTSYLGSGGSQFKMPTITLNGQQRTPPDFGFGPRPASAAQMQGAAALQPELVKRLGPGGSYTPTSPDYLNRGALEQVGQWGGVGTGIGGVISDIFGHGQPSGNNSPQSGLGDIITQLMNGMNKNGKTPIKIPTPSVTRDPGMSEGPTYDDNYSDDNTSY